jgi:hypothetical protein
MCQFSCDARSAPERGGRRHGKKYWCPEDGMNARNFGRWALGKLRSKSEVMMASWLLASRSSYEQWFNCEPLRFTIGTMLRQ